MKLWDDLVKASAQGLEPSDRRWAGLKVSLLGWVIGLIGAAIALFGYSEAGWIAGIIGAAIFCVGIILIFVTIMSNKARPE
jgi:hypothetical protein